MPSRRTIDDTLRIVLTVIVFAPVLVMAFAFPLLGTWGGMMGGFGGPDISPLWSIGMMIVRPIVLVGGGYLVYRWLGPGGSASIPHSKAQARRRPGRALCGGVRGATV